MAKQVDGQITEKYLWLNKTTLLAVYDQNDALLQRFIYTDGNTPTSYEQGGETYYIVTDHLGSPRAITDASGTLLKQFNFDSFGNILSQSNPSIKIPFGFAGGVYDEDTGFTLFGYRDYDPDTGRWTALDPIGFAAGDTNLYGYVFSDPINFVDLDGLSPLDIGFFIYDGFKLAGSLYSGAGIGEAAADFAASTVGLISPLPGTGQILKGGKVFSKAAKKVDLKQTGSYTNTHASGKTYAGKGSRQRSQASGRREAKRNGDPHTATDWTPAKNERDAFKDESRRLDAEDGPGSSSNYNRIEQPGKKYRQEDGEL